MTKPLTEPIVFNPTARTVYDQIGGDPTFRLLVDIFYDRVENDPLLRPIFPEDLEPGKEYQFLFLTQYWGGPARYQVERGHPRLRMRHFHFPIREEEATAWYEHMMTAIDEVGIPEPARSQMDEYFRRSATFLVNQEPKNPA